MGLTQSTHANDLLPATQSQQEPSQASEPPLTQPASDVALNLSHLNQAQKDAVTSENNYVEVLAGPGSGKTLVIVHRIEYLVRIKRVKPGAICCVTFTNRAAKEMKERTQKLLGENDSTQITMGTFHSVCAGILRRYSSRVGIDSNFSIIDAEDANKLLDKIIQELWSPTHTQANQAAAPRQRKSRKPLGEKWAVKSKISSWKNDRITPTQAIAIANRLENKWDAKLLFYARIYERYEALLKRYNFVDFDDLLGYTFDIFIRHPDVLRAVSAQYQHILVDEWQDTSTIQYQIARGLSYTHRSMFIVGDPDQSIYAWRFAEVENLAKFRSENPDVYSVKLEQNYRSGSNILQFSRAIIEQDTLREKKGLIPTHPAGFPVQLVQLSDLGAEAVFVAEQVRQLSEYVRHYRFGHTAVLYRANSQSRLIEEEMVRRGIPYRVVGADSYYERREVKDLISYLRVVGNTRDEISLERIINVPYRGISKVSMDALREKSASTDASLWSTLAQTFKETKQSIGDLVGLIDWLQKQAAAGAPSLAILDGILEFTKYLEYLREQDEESFESQAENIEEFRTACHIKDLEYDELAVQNAIVAHPEAKAELPQTKLQFLLAHLALVAGTSQEGKKNQQRPDAVNLLTMHSSKGLEWPVVFIIGCDQKGIPSPRAENIPEERRLLYVSATRAKSLLYASYPRKRINFNSRNGPVGYPVAISPFLEDLTMLSCVESWEVFTGSTFVKNPKVDVGFTDSGANGTKFLEQVCQRTQIDEPNLGAEDGRGDPIAQPMDPILLNRRKSTSALLPSEAASNMPADPGQNPLLSMKPPNRSVSLQMMPLDVYLAPTFKWTQKGTPESNSNLSKKRKRDDIGDDNNHSRAPASTVPPGTDESFRRGVEVELTSKLRKVGDGENSNGQFTPEHSGT